MTQADIQRHCLKHSLPGQLLSTEHVNVLLQHLKHSIFEPGATVFAEGDTATSLSVICSGEVALEMHVPVRGSIRILTLGPRDVLGWSALVGDGHMSASAVTLEESHLLQFPSETLRALCASDAEPGRNIILGRSDR